MSGAEVQETYARVITWTDGMLPVFGTLALLAAFTLGVVVFKGLRP